MCAVALSIWAETLSGPFVAFDESRDFTRKRTSSVEQLIPRQSLYGIV